MTACVLEPYDGSPDVRPWFFDPETERFLNARGSYEPLGRSDYEGWFLALHDGTPCAIVGAYGTLSQWWVNPLIVAPEHRGKGLSVATLRALIEHPETPPELWARIDRRNTASLRCFASLGFLEEPEHSDNDTVFLARYA